MSPGAAAGRRWRALPLIEPVRILYGDKPTRIAQGFCGRFAAISFSPWCRLQRAPLGRLLKLHATSQVLDS